MPPGSHLPSAQVTHAVWAPLSSNLPSAHALHATWFFAEMEPSSHAIVTVASPTTGHFRPAGHSPQSALVPVFSADQRPPLQAWHAVRASAYFPAAHGMHENASVLGCTHPSGQEVHDVVTPELAYVPASQAILVVAPPDWGQAWPPGLTTRPTSRGDAVRQALPTRSTRGWPQVTRASGGRLLRAGTAIACGNEIPRGP